MSESCFPRQLEAHSDFRVLFHSFQDSGVQVALINGDRNRQMVLENKGHPTSFCCTGYLLQVFQNGSASALTVRYGLGHEIYVRQDRAI